MIVTAENYFSKEVAREYMSTSQYKAFMKCPAAIMAEINGEIDSEEKEAFLEGHLFEALVCSTEESFFKQHPEIISSQGKTKGNVKTNFQKVVNAAEAFKNQNLFRKIIERCEKQVVVTGEIAGIKFRGMIDLYDPKTGEIYDTKCMKDFKSIYSSDEGCYLPWWNYYGYHYQAAIYCELVRQTFGKQPAFSLLAATKETVSDLSWTEFSSEVLRNTLDIIEETAPTFQAIKDDMISADRCECCNYCKQTKIITSPEIIEVGGINE